MKNIKVRLIKARIFKTVITLISTISIFPLFLIIFYIVKNGIKAINWELLTSLPSSVGEEGGGIIHSIAGTFILIIIASLFSIPLGIGAGIYVSEHRNSKIANFIRLCVEVLQGIPSIVIGISVYLWIVLPMGNFSALSGGIALGIMMLPMIIKSTDETLKLIPPTLKEASIALGVPYYKTILKVILPAGLKGIVTGILIGIARIAGETAPLLFTAFGNNFLNLNILKPVDALPLLIFNYATSPYEQWHKIAWGASFILVSIVLFLNIITQVIIKKWNTQF